jgi:choline-sulfatase
MNESQNTKYGNPSRVSLSANWYNTTIISISDHGEMLGNHGFWTKSVMYEDSAGIPLIMTRPGIAPRVNPTPVSLTDIASTVEQAVSMSPASAQSGFSGRPLQSFLDAPETDRPILSEYHDGGSPTGFFMLRRRNWKYIHYAGGHPPQFFNLDTDPDELDDLGTNPNIAEVRDGLVSELQGMLDPEVVNAQAFADQALVLASLGGAEERRK